MDTLEFTIYIFNQSLLSNTIVHFTSSIRPYSPHLLCYYFHTFYFVYTINKMHSYFYRPSWYLFWRKNCRGIQAEMEKNPWMIYTLENYYTQWIICFDLAVFWSDSFFSPLTKTNEVQLRKVNIRYLPQNVTLMNDK